MQKLVEKKVVSSGDSNHHHPIAGARIRVEAHRNRRSGEKRRGYSARCFLKNVSRTGWHRAAAGSTYQRRIRRSNACALPRSIQCELTGIKREAEIGRNPRDDQEKHE